jgi:hypothetical protein
MADSRGLSSVIATGPGVGVRRFLPFTDWRAAMRGISVPIGSPSLSGLETTHRAARRFPETASIRAE